MSCLLIRGKRGEEACKTVVQERSEEFRRAAVVKFHSRGNRTVAEIAQGLGVSSWSLYQWSKRYGKAEGMKQQRRPSERSAQEKLKAVIEFEGLTGDKQGEYLRREGLHSDHIAGWKKRMEAGLEGGGALSGASRTERALAETAALLALKKKLT